LVFFNTEYPKPAHQRPSHLWENSKTNWHEERHRRRGKLRLGAWCLITFGKEKPDRILVFTKADGTGLTFIKRRPDGALGKLFVSFTYTPTAFNGWRPWFCCPGCGKRCRCLYGANTLRCRKCLGLVYASQSERTYWRALRRADAIRDGEVG
jgi:hypothetical protein